MTVAGPRRVGLRQGSNPRMYGMLMANYSRLGRVQPPGAAPEPTFLGRFQRFPTLPAPARCRAAIGGTVPEPERRPIPGTHAPRDGFERRCGHNRTRRGPLLISG